MKKKFKKSIIICLASISMLILSTNSSMLVYAGPYDTFKISTPEELFAFARAVNSGVNYPSVELTNDIYVGTDNIWTPIGTLQHPFCGEFDGKGHTITGLGVKREQGGYVGLFGVVGRDSGYVGNVYYGADSERPGTVKNVTVAKSYFKGLKYVGGICGYAYGNIINCNTVEGEVYGNNCVGGNVGHLDGSISGCSNSAIVTGGSCAGGNAGETEYGVFNCLNLAKVIGTENVGGNVGYNCDEVKECTNKGNVSGFVNVGGNVGLYNGYCWKKGKGIKGKENSILEKCENTGSINGKHRIGGNVGWLQADGVGKVGGCTGEVRNCINLGDVCGTKKDIGGNIGKSGNKGIIYNCKNSGCVVGKKNTGLNIGLNNGKATGCTGTGKVIKK